MQCLQVRSSENQPWQLFYGEIEGFTPQPDTAYYLKLRYETVPNPPADASAVRTILERVVFSETISRKRRSRTSLKGHRRGRHRVIWPKGAGSR
jgi:hypothetical protein